MSFASKFKNPTPARDMSNTPLIERQAAAALTARDMQRAANDNVPQDKRVEPIKLPEAAPFVSRHQAVMARAQHSAMAKYGQGRNPSGEELKKARLQQMQRSLQR